jgi:hypothetical protein
MRQVERLFWRPIAGVLITLALLSVAPHPVLQAQDTAGAEATLGARGSAANGGRSGAGLLRGLADDDLLGRSGARRGSGRADP